MRSYTTLARSFAATWFLFGCFLAPPSARGQTSTPPAERAPEAPPAPWVEAFLTAPAADVVAAAKAIAGDETTTLYEEGRFVYDERGTATTRYRAVTYIADDDAVGRWQRIHASYRPWSHEPPKARARACLPDGRVADLDEAARVHWADDEADAGRGHRGSHAPLTELVPGSVVEFELVTRSHEPVQPFGGASLFYFGGRHGVRLEVDVPRGRKVAFVRHGLDAIEERHEVRGDREVWTFASGPVPAAPAREPLAPRDAVVLPRVAWSIAPSWEAIATELARRVDESLAEADLRPLLERLPREDLPPRDLIARTMELLGQEVGFSGLRLGDVPLRPQALDHVLAAGRGDRLDLAALLVGVLRARGLDAAVALIHMSEEPEPEPALPGTAWCDHAVVRVRGLPDATAPAGADAGGAAGERGVLWVDPASPLSDPGDLPSFVQDRAALLLAPGLANPLTRTPRARSDHNTVLDERTITLGLRGPAPLVREVDTLRGEPARTMRARLAYEDAETVTAGLRAWAAREYATGREPFVELDNPFALGAPFQMRFEATQSGRAWVDYEEAEVVCLGNALVFDRLPSWLYRDESAEEGGEGEEGEDEGEAPSDDTEDSEASTFRRTQPMVLPEPHRYEIRYRIEPPPGYTPREPLPPPMSWRAGPARFAREVEATADGAVEVRFVFDTGHGRFTALEAFVLAARVRKTLASDAPVVFFDAQAALRIAAGRPADGLAVLRRTVELRPDDAVAHAYRALGLNDVGLGAAAQLAARHAARLAPDDAWVQLVLGDVLRYDATGTLHGPGFDRRGARAALERAIEGGFEFARAWLVGVLQADVAPGVPAPIDDLREAVRLLRTARRDGLHDPDDAGGELAELAWRALDAERAFPLARALPPGAPRDDVLVAALARAHGARIAVSALDHGHGVARERRTEVLREAAKRLARSRWYAEAAALCEEGARGARFGEARALRALAKDMAARVGVVTDPAAVADDPVAVVKAYIWTARTCHHTRTDDYLAWFAPEARETAGPRDDLLRFPFGFAHWRGTTLDAELPHLADAFVQSLRFAASGDDRFGFEVRVHRASDGALLDHLLLARRPEGLRIVGNVEAPELAAYEVVRQLDAGDLDAASAWLDRIALRVAARDGLEPARAIEPSPAEPDESEEADPAVPRRHPPLEHARVDLDRVLLRPIVERLWGSDRPRDPARARTVAAILLGRVGSRDAFDAMPPTPLHEDPWVSAHAVVHVEVPSLVMGERFEDLLRLADALAATYPRAAAPHLYRVAALVGLGRHDAASAALAAWRTQFPTDERCAGKAIYLARMRGDAPEASLLLDKMLTVPPGEAPAPLLQYFRATLGCFLPGGPTAKDEELARAAADSAMPTMSLLVDAQLTLACILAERGEPADALSELALAASQRGSYAAVDAYVVGRVAERFGERDEAIRCYRLVLAEAPDPAPFAPARLAERRLVALGVREGF